MVQLLLLIGIISAQVGKDSMASFNFKYPATAHIGNKVSHAKNRSKRKFKYNLHTVTVLVDGEKQRLKVPTKMLRMLKKSGVTTHYQNTKDADKA